MRFLAAFCVVMMGLLAACAVNDDHTGFACGSTVVAVTSSDCTTRVQSAKCVDGGYELRGDGGPNTQQCCNFQSCATDPYPEFHK